MRVRSLASGLVVPALLVGLVVLLATMQYRWLGQVSEAEREQLQRSLSQRARDFADDFDGEITRLYLALQSETHPQNPRGLDALPAALDGWKASTRFPQMVCAVYLAEPDGKTYTLRAYDPGARGFASPLDAWPATVAPLRERLGGIHRAATRAGGSAEGQILAIGSPPPMFPEIPALVIPIAGLAAAADAPPAPNGGNRRLRVSGEFAAGGKDVLLTGVASDALTRGAVRWLQAPRAYLVVALDLEVMKTAVVPALVARHFPADDSTPYRIVVRTSAGATVFARGMDAGATIDSKQADAAAVFFRVRPEILHDGAGPAVTVTTSAPSDGNAPAAPARPAGQAGSPAQLSEPRQFSIFVQQWSTNSRSAGGDGRVAMRQTVLPAGGWQIMLQHAAGSLDIAVAQARRRNLALSFGILTVLAAGVMLVVVNARRTKQLASRQMDFVATVTHELRTPLAVIRSAAQNLSAGVVGEPAQTRTYGDLIDKEGRRLTDMVEQVLAYAGLEAGQAPRMTQRVDLSHLVNDVLDACQPLCAEAGIAVEFDADAAAGAPAVVGDEAGLRLVMQNVVGNALKHGADGRWIGVAVTSAMRHGRTEVCVTVTDRGRGIEAAELAHVFDPFYRGRRALDDQIRGNGLGLSLVKRIVEAHGGRVAVESSPGAGATFTIALPAAAAETRA